MLINVVCTTKESSYFAYFLIHTPYTLYGHIYNYFLYYFKITVIILLVHAMKNQFSKKNSFNPSGSCLLSCNSQRFDL